MASFLIYTVGFMFGLIMSLINKIIRNKRKKEYLSGICTHYIVQCNCCITTIEKPDREKNKRKKIIKIAKIIIGILFVIAIITISVVLIIKYGLLAKIKEMLTYVFSVAKKIFLFLIGLCTPYLSKRMTKKLKKLRKKMKKRKKKKNNKNKK